MINQHAFNRLFEFKMKAWNKYLNSPNRDERVFWAHLFNFFAEEINQY